MKVEKHVGATKTSSHFIKFAELMDWTDSMSFIKKIILAELQSEMIMPRLRMDLTKQHL